jgi:putative membrane protein
MNRKRIVLATAAVLACAGCMGDKNSERSSSAPSSSSSSSQASTMRSGTNALSESDRTFVTQAASAGLFEVQSSELALQQQGLSNKEREFAQMMVDDHGKANRELMKLAANKGVTVPTQLLKSDQQQLDQLKNRSSDDFAKQYRSLQKKAHDDAIALFEKESRDGQDAELRAFAEKTLPTLRKHRQHIDQLQ